MRILERREREISSLMINRADRLAESDIVGKQRDRQTTAEGD